MIATRNMIAGIALLMSATSAISQETINRTILGVDKSGSSTFLYERHSADAAASYVNDYIAGLAPPHDLLMISVGDTGMAERDIHIRAKVTERRASNPRRMAEQFGGYFRALPQLISHGAIAPDDTTSLVEFFQSLEDICSEAPNGSELCHGKRKPCADHGPGGRAGPESVLPRGTQSTFRICLAYDFDAHAALGRPWVGLVAYRQPRSLETIGRAGR